MTLNAKNVKSNQIYVKNLLQSCDICCVQEHWLFQFQLDMLNEIDSNFQSHAKAVDERDPISPLQVPRGYGGNAILLRKNWDLKTSLRKDGSDRIVVLEIEAIPSICIISAYLPCRGNTSRERFTEVLQEVEELLHKYSSNHAVFICGDLNSSLTRQPPNDRDSALREFVSKHNLLTQQHGEPTFFHASGDTSAELDYILKNDLAAEISQPVKCMGQHHNNVSDHVPLFTEIEVKFRTGAPTIRTHPRPDWAKCNRKSYEASLNSLFNITHFQPDSPLEDGIEHLTDIVVKATKTSIPGYDPKGRNKKKRPPKPRGPDIQGAAKLSKEAWWRWKCEGSPVHNDHPLKTAMTKAKRNLRKIQRRSHAERRTAELEQIMHSKDINNMFYQLIRKQRTTSKSLTNCIFIDDIKLSSPEEITEGWATHFGNLATPKAKPEYDDTYLDQALEDLALVQDLLQTRGDAALPTDVEEVRTAVSRLNNNKSADYMGLMAEHFKYGGDILYPALVQIINVVFAEKRIPSILKSGTITPIFKKGDIQYPDNYRGITVTSILLKIMEHILNNRHRQILMPTQSRLQSGFTKGTSSVRSALIVSECQLEAKSTKEQLILITLDTRKAFDVVNHSILLRNLLLDGINPAEWSILHDLYSGMTSSVKWQGRLSDPFSINQGVRQGGVLSTEHYKRYNNPLLLKLEDNFRGARIGCIAIPHTTCADDLALLSHSDWETRLMLKTVEDFSRTHRYDINPAKSVCIIQNAKTREIAKEFQLQGESIPLAASTTHLGVHRDTKGKVNTEDKVKIGRRTAYSLLGAGFHGKNGIKQDIKAHIWSTYVIPRMLYGLEVLSYNQTDLKKLEAFQTKTLKQIQHLADRTANVAASALLGVPPISAQIHKNTLNLFYGIIQNPGTVEYSVAERQLAIKALTDESFFSRARRLLLLYDLPNAYSLLASTPEKETWKNILSEAVNQHVTDNWKSEIQEKSSLKYLNPEAVSVGRAHHVYTSVRPNQVDVKRAEIKAKLLTGTYTLQSNRAVFNQYAVDPTCRICNSEAETRIHFISRCPAMKIVREKYKTRIHSCLATEERPYLQDLINGDDGFTQLVLDCTHPTISQVYRLTDEEVKQMELLSRELIWKLHIQRCRELAGDP